MNNQQTANDIGWLKREVETLKRLLRYDTLDRELTIEADTIVEGDLTADDVILDDWRLNTSTHKSVIDWFNVIQSSGYITGGDFIDNGDGTLTVQAGVGIIKTVNSAFGPTLFFNWPETTLTPPNNDDSFIIVAYNGGSPVVYLSSTKTADARTSFYLGKVFRYGDTIHTLKAGLDVTEPMKRTQSRLNSVHGEIVRASGLVCGETGERYLTITAGVLFAGLTRYTTDAVDTSGADTFEYWYHSSGEWTFTNSSQIENAQYDNGTDLVNLTSNRYAVSWVYMGAEGTPIVVAGTGNYTLTQAEEAQPPAVPGRVSEFSTIIAKIIIVQEGGTSFYSVRSAFDIKFATSVITQHNELGGLEADDHTQYLLVDGTRAMSGDLRILADNKKISLGADSDFSMYFDGTHAQLVTESGDIDLKPASGTGVLAGLSTTVLHVSSMGSGGSSRIEIGALASGNRYSYIDFIGDDTYTDFGLRLLRENNGPNSNSVLKHRGTGNLQIYVSDAGNIAFVTNNASRGYFLSDGTLRLEHTLKLRERSAAAADTGGYGQLWVKNTTPCELWFTDDAGNDTRIA